MVTSREKIMERRKKLQAQRKKDEVKLKALQIKLKKSAQQINQIQKKEEAERKVILGSLMLEKAKTDASFQKWLEEEISNSNLSDHKKSLFENFKQA
ncbi:MAG: hypothetical protein H7A32_04740 [Deltaproteobacteria bacterium]|nr:hypothetical protein [Deltaproteobacteria bacterium]